MDFSQLNGIEIGKPAPVGYSSSNLLSLKSDISVVSTHKPDAKAFSLKHKQHHVTLHNFPVENGKISFNTIRQLAEMLQVVAGGSLRLLVEGISSKKGPKPSWLETAIDFQLSDIKQGSTQLTVEAPLLKESLYSTQIPIFGRNPASLHNYTGIDLALESFHQAFQTNPDDDLLDRALLRDMDKYRTLFHNKEGIVDITGFVNDEPTKITYDSFENIRKQKIKTPPPSRVRVSGLLDLMQFSKDLIQLKTEQGIIRAVLSSGMQFSEISQYLGKTVSLDGIANFKPSGKISAIEVEDVKLSDENDTWFTYPPKPIREQLEFKELRSKQNYRGTKLNNIVGEWPGDESIDDLLEMLDK